MLEEVARQAGGMQGLHHELELVGTAPARSPRCLPAGPRAGSAVRATRQELFGSVELGRADGGQVEFGGDAVRLHAFGGRVDIEVRLMHANVWCPSAPSGLGEKREGTPSLGGDVGDHGVLAEGFRKRRKPRGRRGGDYAGQHLVLGLVDEGGDETVKLGQGFRAGGLRRQHRSCAAAHVNQVARDANGYRAGRATRSSALAAPASRTLPLGVGIQDVPDATAAEGGTKPASIGTLLPRSGFRLGEASAHPHPLVVAEAKRP
jgi:hypothetical protein